MNFLKTSGIAIALLFNCAMVHAQKRVTTSAVINFDATTRLNPLPKAENNTAIGSIDLRTGAVAFEVTIKNFSFVNPRMQSDFNGKVWMDSDQYPTSTFKGKIINLSEINFKADGKYSARVEGSLTIHGVTNDVATNATFIITGKKIQATALLALKMKDYNISGPAIGAGKVAADPTVSISAEFK